MACQSSVLVREFAKFLFLTLCITASASQTCLPDWDTELTIQFVNYSNPTGKQGTKQLCDRHDPQTVSTDLCHLLFSLCISDIGKSDCKYYDSETRVLTQGRNITFGRKFGSVDNPLSVSISSGSWQGVNIQVTVFGENKGKGFPLYHIDEFVFDIKLMRDGAVRTFSEISKRLADPSRLVLRVYSECVEVPPTMATPDITATTTTTTTTKTTTTTATTTRPEMTVTRSPTTVTPEITETATPTSTTPAILETATPDTTKLSPCDQGIPRELIISLFNYSNPSNRKALGQQCEENDRVTEGTYFCDLMFEICISRSGSRNCEYLYMLSPVLAEGTEVRFPRMVTKNWTNPAKIRIDNMWKGVHVKVKVLDRDGGEKLSLDIVDEFNFEYSELNSSKAIKQLGDRAIEPSELYLGLQVGCAENLAATKSTLISDWTVLTRAFSTVSPPECSADSPTLLVLHFVSYDNPSDEKAMNQLCDRDDPNAASNDFCDLVFSVCISDIGKRDCKHYELETGILKEGTSIVFGNTFWTQSNPFTVYLGPSAQQGVNIYVTVFDQDKRLNLPLDQVDEFEFDYIYRDGATRTLTENGKRLVRPSRLELKLSNNCLSKSSTPDLTSTTPQAMTQSTPTQPTTTQSTTAQPTTTQSTTTQSTTTQSTTIQPTTTHSSTTQSITTQPTTTQSTTTQSTMTQSTTTQPTMTHPTTAQPTTTQSTTTQPTTVQPTTTIPTTTQSTTTASTPGLPLCTDSLPTEITINLLNYSNPSNRKALGLQCEENDRYAEGSSLCDLMFYVCVSRIGSRNCEYIALLSPVLAEATIVHFSPMKTSGWFNPIRLQLDNQWKGIHISVKVLDRDGGEKYTLDTVDEFGFDYTKEKQNQEVIMKHMGFRQVDPTELYLGIKAACPGNYRYLPYCEAGYQDNAVCSYLPCELSPVINTFCRVRCGLCQPK